MLPKLIETFAAEVVCQAKTSSCRMWWN